MKNNKITLTWISLKKQKIKNNYLVSAEHAQGVLNQGEVYPLLTFINGFEQREMAWIKAQGMHPMHKSWKRHFKS